MIQEEQIGLSTCVSGGRNAGRMNQIDGLKTSAENKPLLTSSSHIVEVSAYK